MEFPEDRTVDEEIRRRVIDSVPSVVEKRLRGQLAEFRSRLSLPEATSARPAGSWRSPAAWWKASAMCAAVLVLILVGEFVLTPRSGFAEVQAALLKRPWVHLRSVGPDQAVGEAWFSTQTDISATRMPGSFKFEDHRLHVYYSYDAAEQVLYRGPVASNTSEASQMGSLVEGLGVLLQGAKLPDKPFSQLGFFGTHLNDQQVVEQRVDKVKEGDREWLDYRITVKYPKQPDPVRMTFRVDAMTKLPKLSRIEGVRNGQPMVREIQFDYPEKGPADIHELGVPKTAKLVDRVPTGDLERILDSIRAGRQRMDNYRAVFVTQRDGVEYNWRARPELHYRKGDRFRRDQLDRGPEIKDAEKPGADANHRQWWFERVKPLKSIAVSRHFGQVSYHCESTRVTAADGTTLREITAVKEYTYNLKPGEQFPADYSMRPEFVCRPPMGIGNADAEPKLDLQPAEGPAGCILLTVEHKPRKGGAAGPFELHRFWLDPQRDYIAMRWEMVEYDDTGKEIITGKITIEETARSPQGVWYVTRARRHNASRSPKGKSSDELYYMYVDFEGELPESLFAVPKVGMVE